MPPILFYLRSPDSVAKDGGCWRNCCSSDILIRKSHSRQTYAPVRVHVAHALELVLMVTFWRHQVFVAYRSC